MEGPLNLIRQGRSPHHSAVQMRSNVEENGFHILKNRCHISQKKSLCCRRSDDGPFLIPPKVFFFKGRKGSGEAMARGGLLLMHNVFILEVNWTGPFWTAHEADLITAGLHTNYPVFSLLWSWGIKSNYLGHRRRYYWINRCIFKGDPQYLLIDKGGTFPVRIFPSNAFWQNTGWLTLISAIHLAVAI